MRPRGIPLRTQELQKKYNALSNGYDRLKRDNIKLSSQLSKLQEDFDNLARINAYKVIDIVYKKIHELETVDYAHIPKPEI